MKKEALFVVRGPRFVVHAHCFLCTKWW